MSTQYEELVRRLSQAVLAWGRNEIEKDWDSVEGVPSNAAVYPDVSPGDVLYGCDGLENEPYRVAVVYKDDAGHIRTVTLDEERQNGRAYLHWAIGGLFRTPEEALRAEASGDADYYRARLEQAEAVLRALDTGEPYGHLLGDPGDVMREEGAAP